MERRVQPDETIHSQNSFQLIHSSFRPNRGYQQHPSKNVQSLAKRFSVISDSENLGNTNKDKPSLIKWPTKVSENSKLSKMRLEKATASNAEDKTTNTEQESFKLDDNVAEPIEEGNFQRIKSVIGIFEKGVNGKKIAKNLATTKPNLKTVEVKSKPNVPPKPCSNRTMVKEEIESVMNHRPNGSSGRIVEESNTERVSSLNKISSESCHNRYELAKNKTLVKPEISNVKTRSTLPKVSDATKPTIKPNLKSVEVRPKPKPRVPPKPFSNRTAAMEKIKSSMNHRHNGSSGCIVEKVNTELASSDETSLENDHNWNDKITQNKTRVKPEISEIESRSKVPKISDRPTTKEILLVRPEKSHQRLKIPSIFTNVPDSDDSHANQTRVIETRSASSVVNNIEENNSNLDMELSSPPNQVATIKLTKEKKMMTERVKYNENTETPNESLSQVTKSIVDQHDSIESENANIEEPNVIPFWIGRQKSNKPLPKLPETHAIPSTSNSLFNKADFDHTVSQQCEEDIYDVINDNASGGDGNYGNGDSSEKPLSGLDNNDNIYEDAHNFIKFEATSSGYYYTNRDNEQLRPRQIFEDEPLYQFYNDGLNEKARLDVQMDSDSDDYEYIDEYCSGKKQNNSETIDDDGRIPHVKDHPLEQTRKPAFQVHNPTSWSQMPEVVNSCIVPTLTEKQRKLQEAKFEILTSERSYVHSLTVLEFHFMSALRPSEQLVSPREYCLLFNNILDVKAVSEMLLNDLEDCWSNDIMLMGICDIVHKHAVERLDVYVKCCMNHSAVNRTLTELSANNSAFLSALNELQSSPLCQRLTLQSFLLLPMQRITRLRLLLQAVLTRLEITDEEYLPCKNAHELVSKIVEECNEEAKKVEEKWEEMVHLNSQIEFPKGFRQIPIIFGNRVLVKRGSAYLLPGKDEARISFRRIRKPVVLLLFTDLLIIVRQTGQSLVVYDYCKRNMLLLKKTENWRLDLIWLQKNLVLLTLLENHENRTAEILLSFESESDIQPWIDVVSPKLSQDPEEDIYEEWDCPQVTAIYEYNAALPDEISLCEGDVVNVTKKMDNGWYQGERHRDGARGWFPANHTQEVSSPHVRAKNRKQRYKLLTLSEIFLQQQTQ